jgi:hypothetical protein
MPSKAGGVSYSLNGATFRGEQAVAGSLKYRLPTAPPMAIGVGFSYGGNPARVGISAQSGHARGRRRASALLSRHVSASRHAAVQAREPTNTARSVAMA